LLIGCVIADRLPRRSLMIGSDVLRLIAQAATAAILISRTAKVWEIAALAVVYGFGNAFFLPTSTGIIPQTVSPERLGWRAFRSRRWLLLDGTFSALGGFAVIAPFLTLGPVVAKDHLSGSVSWAAIVAAFGAGSVLGGLGLLRSAPSRPLLAAMIPPVLLALLAIPAPTAVIAVGAFAGGFGLAIFNTLFETTVQQNIPPSLLSRVAAIDWMLSASLLPLGQALAGPVPAIVGIRAIFVFSATWIVVSTVAILAVPDIREFRNATAVSRDAGESAPQDVRSGPDSS
jgi:hypothetical protein